MLSLLSPRVRWLSRLRWPARRRARPLLAALLVLSALPAPAAGDVLKGPYLVEMRPRSVRMRLEADSFLWTEVRVWPEAEPSRVSVFPASHDAYRVKLQTLSAASAKTTLEREEERYLFEAFLRDLVPGAVHVYRVSHGGETAAEGRFRTFHAEAERTTFIALGDVRTGHEHHRRLAEQFLSHRPDFITIAGDLVGDGRVYAQWQNYFDAEREALREVPVFPAWGNHEQRGGYFERFFPFPDINEGRFFLFWRRTLQSSFDCGPVHVVLIDSGVKHDSAELAWLDRDLAAARHQPWKIAVYHHPTYNEGGHFSTYGLTTLLPVFRKHGLDLTITGHSHLYERSYPIKRARGNEEPMVHVVSGGGGAPLYDNLDAFYLAAHRKAHHFLRIDADRETLRGEAIDLEGNVFDRFVLKKRPAAPAVAAASPAPPGSQAPATPPPAPGAGSPGAAGPGEAGPVVAEENVALWRAFRPALDTTIRFRVPPENEKSPRLPAGVLWALKLPEAPHQARVEVELRLRQEDAAHWQLTPESDRFEWSAKSPPRFYRLAPLNTEALRKKILPRLTIVFRSPFGEFEQPGVLRMTFSGDKDTTARDRL